MAENVPDRPKISPAAMPPKRTLPAPITAPPAKHLSKSAQPEVRANTGSSFRIEDFYAGIGRKVLNGTLNSWEAQIAAIAASHGASYEPAPGPRAAVYLPASHLPKLGAPFVSHEDYDVALRRWFDKIIQRSDDHRPALESGMIMPVRKVAYHRWPSGGRSRDSMLGVRVALRADDPRFDP